MDSRTWLSLLTDKISAQFTATIVGKVDFKVFLVNLVRQLRSELPVRGLRPRTWHVPKSHLRHCIKARLYKMLHIHSFARGAWQVQMWWQGRWLWQDRSDADLRTAHAETGMAKFVKCPSCWVTR